MTPALILAIAAAVVLCIVGGVVAWMLLINRKLNAGGTGSDDGSTGE